MKVNAFPSLTWNFLNINDADLELEVPVQNSAQEIPGEFKNIETGMGKEFDGHFDSLNLEKLFVTESSNFIFDYDDDEFHLQDVLIKPKKNSSATIIFCDKGSTKISAKRIRVLADEYSKVHLVFVNMLSENSQFIISVGTKINDKANVKITELELGGKIVFSGIKNLLAGYESFFEGSCAYSVKNNCSADFNYISMQTGRSTKSIYNADGVLDGNAKKIWRGTIDFKKGCVDSTGDEQEDVLLLNSECVNKTLPVILCDEEAVEGRHGSSIGKLDMEKLFYMQSRGINQKTAEELLVKAKVIKVLRNIENQKLKEEILEFI